MKPSALGSDVDAHGMPKHPYISLSRHPNCYGYQVRPPKNSATVRGRAFFRITEDRPPARAHMEALVHLYQVCPDVLNAKKGVRRSLGFKPRSNSTALAGLRLKPGDETIPTRFEVLVDMEDGRGVYELFSLARMDYETALSSAIARRLAVIRERYPTVRLPREKDWFTYLKWAYEEYNGKIPYGPIKPRGVIAEKVAGEQTYYCSVGTGRNHRFLRVPIVTRWEFAHVTGVAWAIRTAVRRNRVPGLSRPMT